MSRYCCIKGAGLLLVFALAGPASAQGVGLFDASPAQTGKAKPGQKRKQKKAPPAPAKTAHKKQKSATPALPLAKKRSAKKKSAPAEARRGAAKKGAPVAAHEALPAKAPVSAQAARPPDDEGVSDLVTPRSRVVMPAGSTPLPAESARTIEPTRTNEAEAFVAPPPLPEPVLQRAASASRMAPPPAPSAAVAPAADAPASSDLSFDLLGAPASPPPAFADPGTLQLMGARRAMLTMHQVVGYGLVTAMAGSVITGQLNYSDRFGGASTSRFKNAHTIFTGVTLGTFAGAGLLAFFAPVPPGLERSGIDRVWLHEAGMIGATAGMVAEGTLGILTASREGAANQSTLAATHLVIGYLTLAFMSVAVGAIVF